MGYGNSIFINEEYVDTMFGNVYDRWASVICLKYIYDSEDTYKPFNFSSVLKRMVDSGK